MKEAGHKRTTLCDPTCRRGVLGWSKDRNCWAVARGWGRGSEDLLSNRCRVSALQDEKNYGDGQSHNSVKVLSTPELCALRNG